MGYIDLHCDTLGQAFVYNKDSIYEMPEVMVDLKRLKEAKALAQFFAIFLMPESDKKSMGKLIPEDDIYIDSLIRILHHTIDKYPEQIAMATNVAKMWENEKEGKVSAFLTIEDGRSVNGSMEKLEEYYKKGVRLISLTWNFDNCFGAANTADPVQMKNGLTAFGKNAVKRMEELGMLVDVSHLSDGGFYDVADILNVPFVASHSNCRELCGHPRNMTNDMIRVLSEKGGVAGLNFYQYFLNEEYPEQGSRICDMVAHVNHMVKYGGEDVIAIGSDFDGISGEKFDVGSPLEMQLLFDALKGAGYTERQIDKFAYGNALRVMEAVLK